MKLAIFSDVHGNLPALEIMLKEVGSVDGYICLGDMVNYGPWSNECVDLVLSLPNITIVKGNHERYFLTGNYDGTNQIARAFFDFCYSSFSRQSSIDNLPAEYILNGFIFRHTVKNDEYVYPDSKIVLDHNYVIGHSHHQFKIDQPPFTLYNPGSVGQNRRYINAINYLTLEAEAMNFTMHTVLYDEQKIIKEMKKQGYPAICVDYYDSKERLKK